jgi:hypothetical protein
LVVDHNSYILDLLVGIAVVEFVEELCYNLDLDV